jgi:hypothetical protein
MTKRKQVVLNATQVVPASIPQNLRGEDECVYFKRLMGTLGQQEHWHVLGSQIHLGVAVNTSLPSNHVAFHLLSNLASTADLARQNYETQAALPSASPTLVWKSASAALWSRKLVDKLLYVYFPDMRIPGDVPSERTPHDPIDDAPTTVKDAVFKDFCDFPTFVATGMAALQKLTSTLTRVTAPSEDIPDWIHDPVVLRTAENLDQVNAWLMRKSDKKAGPVLQHFVSGAHTITTWANVCFFLLSRLYADTHPSQCTRWEIYSFTDRQR